MRFIETPVFTRAITQLLEDSEYQALQIALVMRPALGTAIPGCHGLRKLRWSVPGKGKRGGVRIIYFWDKPSDVAYLLYAYRKNVMEDLTRQQLKTLARLVREEFQ